MSFLDSDELYELKDKKQMQTITRPATTSAEPAKRAVPKKIIYKTFEESEKVHINKVFDLSYQYDDFTSELYPNSLNFYDFEVFMGDWLVVIINPVEKRKTIICNDSAALKEYYKKHRKEFWVGYNSRNYDTFIMKSILLDLNPKKTSDMIILYGVKGNQIDDGFKKIKFLDFDIATKIQGLKQLEAFMGNDIRETTVPFDIDRLLTKSEIKETIKYCMHDVEQTIEVFRRRKEVYESQVDLINTFELPIYMISNTQAQLTANILGCKRVDGRDDEFDLDFVDSLKIKKYKHILDWFKNRSNRDYSKSLETEVCGIPHTFGWGGLHGCPIEPIHRKGRIFHVDVTSYYPSIMIEYDFLSRNCEDKNKFKEIYDKRVALKKAGKKKEQAPYKIILNSTYGICKDKYSQAYDPRQANNVCINGQLMLLDLLEHLEGYADIIQSNTDGIILQIEDTSEAEIKMREICQEWMNRTKMGLGFDEITEIWQGDVNNYVFRFSSGKLEKKGAYVMDLDDLSYDLPIVNKAIVEFLTEGISPKKTINSCNDLREFQKIVKVSSKYKYGWHNNEFLTDKTFRVFASKNSSDSYIGKCKYDGATVEKFANTPLNCFIDNTDIKGKEVPEKLDRKWYISLAEERIEKKFGLTDSVNKGLF